MIEELRSIGLTDGEAKAYLALLKLGISTVGPVVKESGISYSKIYEVLGRLLDKGLISYGTKEKTKYFQAVAPNRLTEFLEKKENEIKRNKEVLKQILPNLEKVMGRYPKEEASVFIGTKGLKTAYELLLENHTKGEFLLFFMVYEKEYVQVLSSFYKQEFHYFKKLNLKLKGITTLDFKRSDYFEKPPSFIKQRYVDFPLPSMIDIYKDKVLFTAWREKPISYLINSKEIAENFRKYFEGVWRIAKP